MVTLKIVQCHPGLGPLMAERQSARMSEIRNGGLDLDGNV